MQDIFSQIEVTVTQENKKEIDKVIHNLVGVDYKDLRAAMRKFRPKEESIRKATDIVIETVAKELSTGFTTEMKAIDDIYYWGVNKLRLKVQYDKDLSVRDLKDVTEFAYKIREGNPLDDTIKAFFATVNNKQEIINMAKEDAGDEESDTGAKESSGSETHKQ